jgi:hypothetical protein
MIRKTVSVTLVVEYDPKEISDPDQWDFKELLNGGYHAEYTKPEDPSYIIVHDTDVDMDYEW